MGQFIGKAVKRREDARFLKGAGTYTDDRKWHILPLFEVHMHTQK